MGEAKPAHGLYLQVRRLRHERVKGLAMPPTQTCPKPMLMGEKGEGHRGT